MKNKKKKKEKKAKKSKKEKKAKRETKDKEDASCDSSEVCTWMFRGLFYWVFTLRLAL